MNPKLFAWVVDWSGRFIFWVVIAYVFSLWMESQEAGVWMFLVLVYLKGRK